MKWGNQNIKPPKGHWNQGTPTAQVVASVCWDCGCFVSFFLYVYFLICSSNLLQHVDTFQSREL